MAITVFLILRRIILDQNKFWDQVHFNTAVTHQRYICLRVTFISLIRSAWGAFDWQHVLRKLFFVIRDLRVWVTPEELELLTDIREIKPLYSTLI